jgi:pimeloyl-ACP methyl ester carboxylesterase
MQDVTFVSKRGVRLKGWRLPSQNHAVVVLCHGSGGDRRSMWDEALGLYARGFGVLLYDSPGHGESEGKTHWGEGELAALDAALATATNGEGVAADGVGVLGSSMGGYVAALVAARNPTVRALALAAAPPHLREHLRWEYRRWGPLSRLPALWAVQLRGLPLDAPMPSQVIAKLAPRPLLLISGSADPVVPLFMTEQLLAAAHAPKRLLLIPGAGHGGYAKQNASLYLDGLAAFFGPALIASR